MTEQEIAELFKDRFTIVGDCWEWNGYRLGGYGQFHRDGRHQLVHRYVLALILGRALQAKALHTCDNPPCFRPLHLYEGTMQDNCNDRDARGHTARHETHGKTKLTWADVEDIRSRYVPGRNRWERGNGWQLRAQYGITKAHLKAIVDGTVWRRES